MIKHKTSMLRELVAPATLEDTLESLRQSGVIDSYHIDGGDTILDISKSAEIKLLMGEESKMRENPRPHIKNKLTKPNK